MTRWRRNLDARPRTSGSGRPAGWVSVEAATARAVESIITPCSSPRSRPTSVPTRTARRTVTAEEQARASATGASRTLQSTSGVTSNGSSARCASMLTSPSTPGSRSRHRSIAWAAHTALNALGSGSSRGWASLTASWMCLRPAAAVPRAGGGPERHIRRSSAAALVDRALSDSRT